MKPTRKEFEARIKAYNDAVSSGPLDDMGGREGHMFDAGWNAAMRCMMLRNITAATKNRLVETMAKEMDDLMFKHHPDADMPHDGQEQGE